MAPVDAQREACEAYILSQKSEGWIVLKTPYDDGGFSGGSMERPGLKRLLEDIRIGKVDVVVVYKVDRQRRAGRDSATGTSERRRNPRIPALALEGLVLDRLRILSAQLSGGWPELLPVLHRVEVHPEAVIAVLAPPEHGGWVRRCLPHDRCVAKDGGLLELTIDARFDVKRGKVAIVDASGFAAVARAGPDRTLVSALRRAHAELRRHGVRRFGWGEKSSPTAWR